MRMRLQRTLTRAQQNRKTMNNPANPTPADGKKAVGAYLKAKGVAIGIAVGVALTSLGDYLLGESGLIPFIINAGKSLVGLF